MDPKRELMSCVNGISVSDERRLLAEIRKLGLQNIDHTTRLSNGMLAHEFGSAYVRGNRKKRQSNMQRSKEKSQRRKEEAAKRGQEQTQDLEQEIAELDQLSS